MHLSTRDLNISLPNYEIRTATYPMKKNIPQPQKKTRLLLYIREILAKKKEISYGSEEYSILWEHEGVS